MEHPKYGHDDLVTLIQRFLFLLWLKHLCTSLDFWVWNCVVVTILNVIF